MLGDLVDDDVERIGMMGGIVGQQAGVGSETRIRLIVGDISGRRRLLLGLYSGAQRISECVDSEARGRGCALLGVLG